MMHASELGDDAPYQVTEDNPLGMESDVLSHPSIATTWILYPKIKFDKAILKTIVGEPPLSLYISDNEPFPSTITMFNILTELFTSTTHDHTAAAKAAGAINQLYLNLSFTPSLNTSNPEPKLLDPEKALFSIYDPLFQLLLQIPPSHPILHSLVNLLSELVKIDIETLNIWGHDIKLWSEMPLSAPEFTELVEQCPDHGSSSLKAFRALLDEKGVYKLHDYSRKEKTKVGRMSVIL